MGSKIHRFSSWLFKTLKLLNKSILTLLYLKTYRIDRNVWKGSQLVSSYKLTYVNSVICKQLTVVRRSRHDFNGSSYSDLQRETLFGHVFVVPTLVYWCYLLLYSCSISHRVTFLWIKMSLSSRPLWRDFCTIGST